MLNGEGELPAFPVRKACEAMAIDEPDTQELLRGKYCETDQLSIHQANQNCPIHCV